jgi:transposase InsO family protein
VKFAAIADWAASNSYPVSFMCEQLGVSRSGYYAWRTAAPSQRSKDDTTLIAIMKKVHARARGNPGVRRLRAELAAAGYRLSHKRVWRLMKVAGLRGRHPKAWKRTTIGGDRPVPAPDLIGRAFFAERPDEKWCGDITYVKTWDGWAYLLVTWNQRAGWIITDRHHDHELRGPVGREHRAEVARPGSARAIRRVAHDLDQSGPCAAHHRRVCARARGVPAGL